MPRARKLFLLPQAREDFGLVREPLRSEIIERLRMLKKFPNIGTPLTGPFRGWRALTVEIFRIYYRLVPRGVEVGFIRHSKRRHRKSSAD